MAKISELGRITGANTKSGDLFVTVSIDQGINGTKNITRKELLQAIQQEDFDNISIIGGGISNVSVSNANITDSIITETEFSEGQISDSVIINVAINESVFNDGEINDSTFNDGTINESDINDSTFNDGTITQSVFNDGEINDSLIKETQIEDSTFENGVINDTNFFDGSINNSDINIDTDYTPNLDDDSYFIVKDVIRDETVKISYGELQNELAETFFKSQKIYVDTNAKPNGNGSYLQPFKTLEEAIFYMNANATFAVPISLSVMPGDYYTNGNLSLPDRCTVVSTNGQYATNIIMNEGYETENVFLVGSGCYVQGFSFVNQRVDNFDNPTKGFAISFRPNATILRSPYIRDCSQISNYRADTIGAPLSPFNSEGTLADLGRRFTLSDDTGAFIIEDEIIGQTSGSFGIVSRSEDLAEKGYIYIRNIDGEFQVGETITSLSGGEATVTQIGPEDFPNVYVGRGGGMLLADRAILNQNSIFPYMLAFGATPRSPNGIGYVAKNGGGINGISSLSIFVRIAFFSLNGGQLTLNNSGTQFGDVSMRAKGRTRVVNPYTTTAPIFVSDQNIGTNLGNKILDNKEQIIDDLWNYLTNDLGYQGYDSVKCARDVGYILEAVSNDMTLETNYWAVVNGIAYTRGASSVVIDEQLVETSAAISFLKARVIEILNDSESISRVSASFDEIIDILENGVGNADTVFFEDTGVANHAIGRNQIQNNKSLIIDDLIDWISENYTTLDYDESLCRRDSGFILDAFSHDINYTGNAATIINAEAYFLGSSSKLPEDQKIPTALAIEKLGEICASVVLGTYSGQDNTAGAASQDESERCIALSEIIKNVILKDTLAALPPRIEPDKSWVDNVYLVGEKNIARNTKRLKSLVLSFVNSEFKFIDENFTRRDAGNWLRALGFDFLNGSQSLSRNFVAGLFDYKGQWVFPIVRNPNNAPIRNVISAIPSASLLPTINNKQGDTYVVFTDSENIWNGDIYVWVINQWVNYGPNDTDLLDSFLLSFDRMGFFIKDTFSPNLQEATMLDAIIEDVTKQTIIDPEPRRLNFGSLIESLAHQFNLAGAGVNKNALPLNFRRVATQRSALRSILQEDGGRVRFSGADELNNQFFAKGLRINGQTGRLEGRPFTSSVRRLARRAANSRVSI
jgi:hypothetical protein